MALDELVDGGIVLETDATTVANRVSMRGSDGEVPLSEQTFAQALQSAKEQARVHLLHCLKFQRAAHPAPPLLRRRPG